MAFLAPRLTGFWPVILARRSATSSTLFLSLAILPTPTDTTTFSTVGVCMTFFHPCSCDRVLNASFCLSCIRGVFILVLFCDLAGVDGVLLLDNLSGLALAARLLVLGVHA